MSVIFGVVRRAHHERGVLGATVRWPFDGAQDERNGGLAGLRNLLGTDFRPLAPLGVTGVGRGDRWEVGELGKGVGGRRLAIDCLWRGR